MAEILLHISVPGVEIGSGAVPEYPEAAVAAVDCLTDAALACGRIFGLHDSAKKIFWVVLGLFFERKYSIYTGLLLYFFTIAIDIWVILGYNKYRS